MRNQKIFEKSISKKIASLSIAKSLPPSFYKKEAKKFLLKFKKSDKNIKYLFSEIVDQLKTYLDLETIGDTISMLQKHTCIEYNKERGPKITALRNRQNIELDDYSE